eukprot:322105-Rhodomonas_salina.1
MEASASSPPGTSSSVAAPTAVTHLELPLPLSLCPMSLCVLPSRSRSRSRFTFLSHVSPAPTGAAARGRFSLVRLLVLYAGHTPQTVDKSNFASSSELHLSYSPFLRFWKSMPSRIEHTRQGDMKEVSGKAPCGKYPSYIRSRNLPPPHILAARRNPA